MHNLKTLLKRFGNGSYKLYKGLNGPYQFEKFQLRFDQIQGDPFASPSKISVSINLNYSAFPPNLFETPVKAAAFKDALSRIIAKNIRKYSKGNRGTGKSGLFTLNKGEQTILDRNAIVITDRELVVRLMTGLPAYGRKIAFEQAIEMFFDELPRIISESCFWHKQDSHYFNGFVNLVEKQDTLRKQLEKKNLVAFVADNSILPRKSGIDDTPLTDAVPFESPESLRVELELPGGAKISGMGIPRGITLITGGGFHGKSTLLNAIQEGIYHHIPGDGREYVISDPHTVKIRAEDGRSIAGVDISTFINNLPGGKTTTGFSTPNASGSTSQAANIMESLEMGASAFLLDEDSSATNFLIRDKRMKELIPDEKEPITPFIDVARELYEKRGVSTIMAVGGSGDYLDIADTVIFMDSYHALDMTERAKEVAKKYPYTRIQGYQGTISIPKRQAKAKSVNPSKGKRPAKIGAYDTGIIFGKERIELAYWEQISERTQYETIGDCLFYAKKKGYLNEDTTLSDALGKVIADIKEQGLDVIFKECYRTWNYYCELRPIDIAAALNRLRTLSVRF